MDPSTDLVKMSAARFFSHTAPAGDCIEWAASLGSGGYGQFNAGTVNGKKVIVRAHRFSWIAHNGPIPTGMVVCHRCDNRRCVNPSHLFLGDYADNNRDMHRKGRGHVFDGTHILGVKNCNAKLDAEKVANIRQLLAAGAKGVDVARAFGVTPANVSSIRLGKTWPIHGVAQRAAQNQRTAEGCDA